MWHFKRFADSAAIVREDGATYTYADLLAGSEKLIAAIGGRCLAFNLCSNAAGSLLGYAAMLNGGIVPVMLDRELNRESLAALLEDYKPDCLWVPSEMSDEFAGCREVCSAWGYSLLRTPDTAAYPLNEDLALLLTTSGSTGSPKLVRQSYKNIRANAESIARYLELDATERPITTLPMSYTYGLSIINSHLWVGASIIITGKTLMQKEFWRQFKEYAATSFGGVPYTYEMLDKLRFFRMSLPSLRTMTQAGGKLSPELHKRFAEYAERAGKHFVVMYGQTEATARMSYLPPEKSLEKYGSMGIAIPGGEFSLIDVDGGPITGPDIVGELVYKGDNVTLGYAESGKDLVKGDENGGVLVTGDMARRDAEGYYYITGRKKRFLKIFGSRVNLDETEGMLRAAFPDMDCACGGVDDKMSVYVTGSAVSEAIARFLAERIGLNHAAFNVIALDKIPRNEAGKILYSELENNER
jgi:acyl-coenzyme A synthetase/AMP-(fatty) acid ligase